MKITVTEIYKPQYTVKIVPTSISKVVSSYHFTDDEYSILKDSVGNEYLHFETKVGKMHVVGNFRPAVKQDYEEDGNGFIHEFEDMHTIDGLNRYRVKVSVTTEK